MPQVHRKRKFQTSLTLGSFDSIHKAQSPVHIMSSSQARARRRAGRRISLLQAGIPRRALPAWSARAAPVSCCRPAL